LKHFGAQDCPTIKQEGQHEGCAELQSDRRGLHDNDRYCRLHVDGTGLLIRTQRPDIGKLSESPVGNGGFFVSGDGNERSSVCCRDLIHRPAKFARICPNDAAGLEGTDVQVFRHENSAVPSVCRRISVREEQNEVVGCIGQRHGDFRRLPALLLSFKDDLVKRRLNFRTAVA
jgi:hypothetical protein